jgi:uncharacterized protein (DUF58 family)
VLALRVASAFPLGLVRCELRFDLPVELLAFPRLLGLGELGQLPGGADDRAFDRSRVSAGDEELAGVREWREGESLRHVHWRISARRGELVLREMRRPSERPVELVLATLVDGPPTAAGRRRAFELAVSLAATLAEHHLRRGHAVRLRLAGEGEPETMLLRGRDGLWRALARLALVEAREGDPVGAAARALARTGPAGRDGERAIAVVAARLRTPAGAARRCVWLDADDPRTDELARRGRPFGLRPPVGRLVPA